MTPQEQQEMADALRAATRRSEEQRSEIGDLTHKLTMARASARALREAGAALVEAALDSDASGRPDAALADRAMALRARINSEQNRESGG